MIFVNPKESVSGIREILKLTDFREAQKHIAAERNPRNRLPLLMHKSEEWKTFLKDTSLFIEDAEQRYTIIT